MAPIVHRTSASLIALRRILRATELFERRLAAAGGLTPAQLRVLQLLIQGGEAGMTPTAMAERMGVTQATVTALVDRLAARSLVMRRRSQTDRRQSHVLIAEAGRAALSDAPDALQQRFVAAFEGIEDWEQAMIVSALERVATMLDAHDLDASPMLAIGEIAPR